MTITIKLDPAVEAIVVPASAARGLSVEKYVEDIIVRHAAVAATIESQPKERVKALEEWVANHRYDGPPLSDEAMRRDMMVRETEWTF